jgi:WD40 repeat protein
MKYGPIIDGSSTSILTTGNDGSFTMKDLRQPSDSTAYGANICSLRNTHNESLLSLALGYDGYIIALSSSKGQIHFIDLRKMTSGSNTNILLGSYVNSHRDAIPQIQFHPERTSTLLSAGEDGLICMYDTTKPTEDHALETVINTGAPCRKAGFFGKYVFCLTGSETASIWDCNTAVCINDFGNFALRDTLGRQSVIPINYLVDAKWDINRNKVLLCAGNHEGNAAIFAYDVRRQNSFWEVSATLIGGHHGIIRAWCPSTTCTQVGDEIAGNTFFTAGEDARMCEWIHRADNTADALMFETEPMETNMTTNRTSTMNRVGGPIRRQRRSSKTAAKPY